MGALRKIISGGQTGVDQAALGAARDCGLEIGGWCPPGRVSEDGAIPAEFPLEETEEERSPNAPDVPRSQRTEWNVRDSDGVLVVAASLGEARPPDRGSEWAMECAKRYKKPLLVCEVDDRNAKDKIRGWIAENGIETVSVGGPSESSAPGIGDRTYELLRSVFAD